MGLLQFILLLLQMDDMGVPPPLIGNLQSLQYVHFVLHIFVHITHGDNILYAAQQLSFLQRDPVGICTAMVDPNKSKHSRLTDCQMTISLVI